MNKNKELDIWVRGILATVMIFGTHTLFAHVKWFSKYSYTDEPLQLAEITDPLFWVLAISSMLVVGLCTYLDKWIEGTQWFINWDKRLRKYQYKSLLILRIATAVVLLFSWQLKTLAMPELAINNEWILWLEFLLAVLLIFRKTVPVAGAGMVVLYLFGIYKFGLFHMLDYFLLPGVAYYFITSNMTNDKIRNTGLLLLYITLGFSLCWAGMEKLVYPEWGTYILKEHPVLTLGLKPDLFIQGAAFIEISVGVMFILGLLQRSLAITVTSLFILTTLVFGTKEVTGHLLIHATLLVFFIEGAGGIFNATPVFYRRFSRNPIFAGMGFMVLLLGLLSAYIWGANAKYMEAKLLERDHPHNVEISDNNKAPQIDFEILPDKYEGWNINLTTRHFNFYPPAASKEMTDNDGYAILTIDDHVTARIYSNKFYLPPLNPGTYVLEITLHNTKYQQITHLGLPVKAVKELIVE